MTKTITLLALTASLAFAANASAQSPDWQKTWDATLAKAKTERKVVVTGSPDPVMRSKVIPAFEQRYGISVDFIAGRAGELVERTRMDRSAGLYSNDAYMTGVATAFNVLYPEKMIDPLKPLLILPEVTDGSKWKRGSIWFMDPEEQYLLRMFSKVGSEFFINTDEVKPGEMRSVYDLLNPKWKGKISTEDPLDTGGNGVNFAANLYRQLGPDFVRKLYIDQKPAISRNRRQVADWVARGTYPICFTCRGDDVRLLQDEGFPVAAIYELEGLRGHAGPSPFLMSIANKPAHPNAARVFINWMATKEALTLYSRGQLSSTLRNDVDESFLDPRSIPREGVSYIEDSGPEWTKEQADEVANKLRLLLKR
jgi:iron(III) transport system substrate-binding protein